MLVFIISIFCCFFLNAASENNVKRTNKNSVNYKELEISEFDVLMKDIEFLYDFLYGSVKECIIKNERKVFLLKHVHFEFSDKEESEDNNLLKDSIILLNQNFKEKIESNYWYVDFSDAHFEERNKQINNLILENDNHAFIAASSLNLLPYNLETFPLVCTFLQKIFQHNP